MAKSTNSGDLIVTSIRVPRDLWARFQDAAWREHRSAAAELRRLIEDRVADASEPEDVAA